MTNSQRGEDEATLAHSDFLKKVPLVLGKDAGKFSSIYKDSMNRDKPCYTFPKREACLMAMSYSYELQAAVFDKMTELERQLAGQTQAPAIPNNLPDALRLAADLAEKNEALKLENQKKAQALAIAGPKAQALDRISASKGSLTFTQAAKVLGVKRSDLTDWLSENGWVYRQNGSWVAYQRHIQNGRLRYKEAHYTDSETEMPTTKPYCHITRKGMTILAEIFNASLAPIVEPKKQQGDCHTA